MVRAKGTVTVAHPVKRVWELMSDWTRLEDWDLNVKAMIPIDKTPKRGVGAGWECKFEFNGRKTDAVYKCKVLDDAKMYGVFEAMSPFVRSLDTLEVVDKDGETEVTAEFQLYFRGLLFPLSFLLDGAMQKTVPIVMKDMEKFINDELK